ncbi:phosphate acetyltransferase [Corynebacterium endometrii]|uniref:Phosphate acetyltransferase n=1 Tax=Corynebacterium endometrii TaxID=2488819 RepID=A0A4P7QHY7_9CORY|nr:phosphate acetyltransferase [Corynebacterium endometrii]QCB29293.1 Phosphate acetyltransferase [Corynebacterium endometrii]
MSESRSALVSVIGQDFSGVDVEAFAAALGSRYASLDDRDPSISAVVSADLLADGPAIIKGIGEPHFDAVAAAAVGVPLLLVAPDGFHAADQAVRNAKEEKATVAGVVSSLDDVEGLRGQLALSAEPVMSAPVFEQQLIKQARAARAHVVLPEGDDDRILIAASQLLANDVCELTILGDKDSMLARAEELSIDISEARLINHLTSPLAEEFAAEFAELRKAKGVTLEQARETMKDISYFATMMVHKGLADGMVSGAAHTTAHTIKPSFQIIKTAPGASVVSSIFLMVMRDRLWAFGDCAVNPNPTAEQLGEIAVVSAKTAAAFGIDPRVAVLSYSTGDSGSGPDVDRAIQAVAAARALDSEVKVEGPLQFDAACDMGVAKKKMPGSEVAGQANVFIFPDLEAGNIAYKTAQRTAGALAVGPILQGLNKPVNDLSRGATVPDIVNTVAITAIQAGGAK